MAFHLKYDTQRSCLWLVFFRPGPPGSPSLRITARTIWVEFVLLPLIELELILLPLGQETIESLDLFKCAYPISVYTQVGGLAVCYSAIYYEIKIDGAEMQFCASSLLRGTTVLTSGQDAKCQTASREKDQETDGKDKIHSWQTQTYLQSY